MQTKKYKKLGLAGTVLALNDAGIQIQQPIEEKFNQAIESVENIGFNFSVDEFGVFYNSNYGEDSGDQLMSGSDDLFLADPRNPSNSTFLSYNVIESETGFLNSNLSVKLFKNEEDNKKILMVLKAQQNSQALTEFTFSGETIKNIDSSNGMSAIYGENKILFSSFNSTSIDVVNVTFN